MKLILTLALCAFGLAACNTVAGVGEDLTEGARSVQNML
ncbi:entericidin EcnAB [Thioclava sp. SK-1]|nr:entericidin EcnAB [Thioclava sp. SK-1]OCX63046.1 entericidin EcnAB [Thioclava sp. SK-1]